MTKFPAILTTFALLFLLACASPQESPITGTSWVLAEMDSKEIPQSDLITLEFLEDSQLKGGTSCNSYFGTYELEDNSFRVTSFQITEAGCPTDELFWREYEYKRALANASSLELNAPELTIRTEDGRRLGFRRAADDPG